MKVKTSALCPMVVSGEWDWEGMKREFHFLLYTPNNYLTFHKNVLSLEQKL